MDIKWHNPILNKMLKSIFNSIHVRFFLLSEAEF